MNDFIQFVKHPAFTDNFTRLSVKGFIILFFSYFVLVVPFVMLSGVVSNILGLTSKVHQLASYKEVFYGILLAPIIEETFFRLIYVFNRRNLFIILSASIAMAIYFIVNDNLLKFTIFVFVIILMAFLLFFFNQSREWFNKNFKVLFYLIAGLFALIHLGNFVGLSFIKMLPGLLLIVPQFIAGIILGYIRVRYGFFYAVGFHTLMNLTLLLQLFD